MLKKLLKRRNKKGFTLIELIVVLVIMAILAAAAIPAMMGYVNNAKKASYLANCRAVYLAAQSAVTEAKAADQTGYTFTKTTLGDAKTLETGKTVSDKIVALVPEAGAKANITYVETATGTANAGIYQMVVTGDSLDAAAIGSIRYFYEDNKYVELDPGTGTNVWND